MDFESRLRLPSANSIYHPSDLLCGTKFLTGLWYRLISLIIVTKLVVRIISVLLMKSFFLFFGFLIMSFAGAAQQKTYGDSLHFLLNQAKKEDSTRVLALCSLADYYGFIQSDSCFYYASQSASLSRKLKYTYGEYWSYLATFHGFNTQGNYPKALQAALNYFKTAEDLKDGRPEVMSQAYYTMGLLNREMANYEEAK